MVEKEFENCIGYLSKNTEKTKELHSLLKTYNELSQESFIRELEKIQKENNHYEKT